MQKIETYVMSHNIEKLLPYVMRHYSQFSKVILTENNSTDNTIKLGHLLGAEIWIYEVPDEINQFRLLEIKENCWKESRADWVIVVDADEFVYHPDLVGVLERTKATVIHPTFHNMFSEVFPTTEGQIYDEVTMGMDGDFWLSKMNVFRPHEVTKMNWAIGCHYAYPEGNVIIDKDSGIKTLHMRFLSRKWVIDHHKYQASRLDKECANKGYGVQFTWTEEETNKYFDDNLPKLKKII